MPTRRSRQFGRALAEETCFIPQRWASIASVAARLGIEREAAEALAAELDDAGLVRVGGGHSVTMGPKGWQLVRKPQR